jgi:exopolysaccharide biosynthesis protein
MKKLTITMIIIDILVACCFIFTYAIPTVRNVVIMTSLNTKTHQYIAYTFYSEETINKVIAADSFIPISDDVKLDDIVISNEERDSYDDEYDEAILTRDEGNEDYKLLKIKVGGYDAYLVAIYDPSKIQLIHSKTFGTGTGQERIKNMCTRYGGTVCINGGMFVDNGLGSDIPMGYLIKNGKIIWQDNDGPANLIGFTNDNKLLLVNATGEEAINMGMRDALEFGPFLIVNGKSIEYNSSVGGYSRAARVAIGQRKDGTVLFLVTEGTHAFGPNMGEIIEVLKQYKAYNAANLDGGSSTQLAINGNLINSPKNVYGQAIVGGRSVVSGFGLIP